MDDLITRVFSSQWRVLIGLCFLFGMAAELGFQSGKRFSQHTDAQTRNLHRSLQASILGMLALMLGFSFSMAVNRYELRRDLVVKEANAIGTTYLRASLLPEKTQHDIEDALRRYVRNRIEFYQAGRDMDKVLEIERNAHLIQDEIWNHAIQAGLISNTPLTATFITSLNETIDLDATRLAAMRNHVPSAVWLLLVVVGFCGVGLTGYDVGLTKNRLWLNQAFLPLLIACVITILVDIDSPRRGLIGISQQSLIDLENILKKQK